MNTLSVVISAYNEEQKLEACLKSVSSLADEVIVVDNSSTDSTAKIARKYSATVLERPNYAMLNTNKNYGFAKATKDWILNLDADERVTPELATEIRDILSSASRDAYWMPRRNIIFGKWIRHGLWWPDKQLRLFKRGKGKFPEKHVHEYLSVIGETGDLASPLTHENYDTISQFLQKLDRIYTVNEAENRKKQGYTLQWYDALRFPLEDFVSVFFAKQGYKDGFHGLMLSMLQAFYAFIIFAKLWEQDGFAEKNYSLEEVGKEFTRSRKTLKYWMLTARIREDHDPLRRTMRRVFRKYVSSR